ncbi:MAG: hypothetical protein A2X12_01135 [Bacteroidetes bacterium GWE2_29_8]|nr:MAG: hypothetical protein A2X12_01135 [Bacteroidetes bacterium GWE2_29_8]OFY14415.1 MAG: hypothetical protein A2X02_01270 [Bacteroidetes bacterium GWF2_29_10]
MGYESSNILSEEANIKDVIEFLKILNYEYIGVFKEKEIGYIKHFYWNEKKDYKSWYGIELSIFISKHRIHVNTRTIINTSYFDIEYINKTIKLLKKNFGGEFITSYGKGRYLKPEIKKLEPSEAGCYLACSDFGSNLMRALLYFEKRIKNNNKTEKTNIWFMDKYNPNFLSNNFLITFLISISENYWKSTYVALLKYSSNKELILKENRINAERLVLISNGQISVEDAFAESISFARISSVCTNFQKLDKNIDFAKILNKPYKSKNVNVFDYLGEMTKIRNKIIHKPSNIFIVEDFEIKEFINIIQYSIVECYKELTMVKGWIFDLPFTTNEIT